VAAGELAFVPRGVPQTFANLNEAPARQLIACTLAKFERYFARMAAERQGTDRPLQPIPRSPVGAAHRPEDADAAKQDPGNDDRGQPPGVRRADPELTTAHARPRPGRELWRDQ
jgi:hypothetical protein